jgi:hypothetical protein
VIVSDKTLSQSITGMNPLVDLEEFTHRIESKENCPWLGPVPPPPKNLPVMMVAARTRIGDRLLEYEKDRNISAATTDNNNNNNNNNTVTSSSSISHHPAPSPSSSLSASTPTMNAMSSIHTLSSLTITPNATPTASSTTMMSGTPGSGSNSLAHTPTQIKLSRPKMAKKDDPKKEKIRLPLTKLRRESSYEQLPYHITPGWYTFLSFFPICE